jgi:hypothetical protein
VARVVIVDIDETRRRLAYSVVRSERLSHYNASFQVFAEGAGSRLVWIAGLLSQRGRGQRRRGDGGDGLVAAKWRRSDPTSYERIESRATQLEAEVAKWLAGAEAA